MRNVGAAQCGAAEAVSGPSVETLGCWVLWGKPYWGDMGQRPQALVGCGPAQWRRGPSRSAWCSSVALAKANSESLDIGSGPPSAGSWGKAVVWLFSRQGLEAETVPAQGHYVVGLWLATIGLSGGCS